MKKVNVAESSSLFEILVLAGAETVLLRTPEGREFLLAEVDDLEDPDDEEILAIAQNRELMDFLDQRFQKPATLSLEEVKKKHGLT